MLAAKLSTSLRLSSKSKNAKGFSAKPVAAGGSPAVRKAAAAHRGSELSNSATTGSVTLSSSSAAEEWPSEGGKGMVSVPSLVVEEGSSCRERDGGTVCGTTVCSELSLPYSEGGELTPEEALALEVGLSAFEYLEECFYTEVAVLDREKFDAIPEIVKSDFAILSHLGKGNFSDVFEVACKGGRLKEAGGDKRDSLDRRDSFARSVNAATLAKPQVSKAPRAVFALKCLRPSIRSDENQFTIGAEDLVHETAVLANLDHENIIKLHGRASGHLTNAFVLNDGYFILLDRLEETLPDRIDKWREDPECVLLGPTGEQLEVARSVASAMCYLHSRGIIFRDLKPANVGFDSQGVLKMFDFGFATGLPEKDGDNPAGFLYDRCGTPRYMAPEVGLSLGYTLPSDVYSFGILLWEICAMDKPFSDIRTTREFEAYVFMDGERPPVSERWPAAIRTLIDGCWTPRPSRRPTMEEVKFSLAMATANGGRRASRKAVRPKKLSISNTGW